MNSKVESAVPIVAALAIGAGLVLFTRRTEPYLPGGLDVSDVDEPPTLTRQGARLLADTIFAAIYGSGDFWTGSTGEREDVVIGALWQCRNDADVLLVIDAYGIRGGSWSLSGQMNLPATLVEYLDRAERETLNQGLSDRGINLRF